jgi:hypothetical protein
MSAANKKRMKKSTSYSSGDEVVSGWSYCCWKSWTHLMRSGRKVTRTASRFRAPPSRRSLWLVATSSGIFGFSMIDLFELWALIGALNCGGFSFFFYFYFISGFLLYLIYFKCKCEAFLFFSLFLMLFKNCIYVTNNGFVHCLQYWLFKKSLKAKIIRN